MKVKLQCGDCGRRFDPSEVEEIETVTAYRGQCRCGAWVETLLGPAHDLALLCAFQAGVATGKGLPVPKIAEGVVPAGYRHRSQ